MSAVSFFRMTNAPIKRCGQVVVILIGIVTLAFLLGEPHVEGRNVDATLVEMYFKDPFLAYVYSASIPFFIALYQAFTLLGYIGKNKMSSFHSVRALRKIQYCGVALVVLIMGAEVYLTIFQRGKDDIAGGVAMGLLAMFISVAIATVAAVLEKSFLRTGDRKNENGFTT